MKLNLAELGLFWLAAMLVSMKVFCAMVEEPKMPSVPISVTSMAAQKAIYLARASGRNAVPTGETSMAMRD